MKIDSEISDAITVRAKSNPRLRQSYGLRNLSTSSGQVSPDNSQRMLNALEPGTIMPIHRHRNTSETMVIVRGKLIERFYDDNGNITDEFVMTPISIPSLPSVPAGECNEPPIPMLQIEAGQWHSLEVLESGTIIFEAKDGKYEPLGEEDILKL